jgi:hypothetical protein
MHPREVLDKLHETPLVKLLPPEMRGPFVGQLLDRAQHETYAAGATVFTRGESETDMGVIFLEGMVRVTLADGQQRYLEAPEIMGEVQLFTPNAHRSATVECVVGGAVLEFGWHDFGTSIRLAFTPEQLDTLRECIKHSAKTREQNLLDSPPPNTDT